MIVIHSGWIVSLLLAASGIESMLFISRLIGGICGGFNTGTFPIYNKEMSPPQIIGKGGAMN